MNDYELLLLYGKRLRLRRENIGMTQAQLAEKVGVSTNFVGMVERGERNTKTTNMTKLIYALGLTLEEFYKDL